MTKTDRPKPEFLRDIEHDGSLLKRIEEIRKAENRAAPAPGFVTQPVTPSYGGFWPDQYGWLDWFTWTKFGADIEAPVSPERAKAILEEWHRDHAGDSPSSGKSMREITEDYRQAQQRPPASPAEIFSGMRELTEAYRESREQRTAAWLREKDEQWRVLMVHEKQHRAKLEAEIRRLTDEGADPVAPSEINDAWRAAMAANGRAVDASARNDTKEPDPYY